VLESTLRPFVLPGHDLLVHVIKQLTASVLVDDARRSFVRVHQMPVPMVKVYTDVFAKVADSVLRVQIARGIIVRYFDRSLINNTDSVFRRQAGTS